MHFTRTQNNNGNNSRLSGRRRDFLGCDDSDTHTRAPPLISVRYSCSVNGSGRFEGYARVLCGIGRELTDTEWLKADGQSSWGEVFKVQWVCTTPLLFSRLPPDLTNLINDNKPVEVAFDGTEMDAICGERLKSIMDGFGDVGAKIEQYAMPAG